MISHMYFSILLFAAALLAVILVLFSHLKLWRKITITTLLVSSSILSYRAMYDFYGYPAIKEINLDDVMVVGFLVDKSTDSIYLWLREGSDVPRSYVIPFSFEVAKFLQEMRKRYQGRPFRSKIKSKQNPMNRYLNSLEDVEMEEVKVLPKKKRIP